jgi:hypothetical protein
MYSLNPFKGRERGTEGPNDLHDVDRLCGHCYAERRANVLHQMWLEEGLPIAAKLVARHAQAIGE